MEKPTEIYRILYLSIKNASDIEHLLRQQSHSGNKNSSTDKILKRFDDVTGNELPACMGKLISELELQGAFQSLGRYVRNFGDAEFVVRKMKEQILGSLADNQDFTSINNLISCSNSIADEFDKVANYV